MKMKYIPFCLCLCLLTACSTGQAQEVTAPTESTQPATQPPESDPDVTLPEELNIPENAAYCQIEHSVGADAYHFYDEHDNEILYMLGTDEDSRITTTFTYNEDGTVASEKVKDFFGKTEFSYTYNKDLTVHQCTRRTDGELEGYTYYEYDSHGQKEKESFVDTRGICMYTISYKNKYDDEGCLISQKEKGMNALAMEMQYEYDENGNVIHEATRSVLLNSVIIEYTYTYDEYGRKRTQEYSGDDVTLHSEFEYLYF